MDKDFRIELQAPMGLMHLAPFLFRDPENVVLQLSAMLRGESLV